MIFIQIGPGKSSLYSSSVRRQEKKERGGERRGGEGEDVGTRLEYELRSFIHWSWFDQVELRCDRAGYSCSPANISIEFDRYYLLLSSLWLPLCWLLTSNDWLVFCLDLSPDLKQNYLLMELDEGRISCWNICLSICFSFQSVRLGFLII